MRILLASSIDADTIAELRQDHDVVCAFNAMPHVLKDRIADCEVLIFRSGVQITAEVMAHAPGLKLLIRAGSGLDNLDMAHVRERGLRLVRIPGPGAQAVAEMAFALMLALARRVTEADRLLKQGHWAKQALAGYNLTGKTLGIVGCGNIGTRTGRLGVAWGMRVLGCVENPTPQEAALRHEHGITLTDLHEVLAQSDFVSLHVPLQSSTRHLINAETLGWMKTGAFLVNLARGGVVDEQALRQALLSGRVRGAALDVHAQEGEGKISPLADLPQVILTPHIGAMTHDAQREIGRLILQALKALTPEPAASEAMEPLVL